MPGGPAMLGTNQPVIRDDFEAPLICKSVKPLWWERGTISIAQFQQFCDATGYVTLADRLGWSFVFYSHLPDAGQGTLGVAGMEWWRRVDGANFANPKGPGLGQSDHDLPATHIAWEDAKAYAAWSGGRLPKEVEWEHAARGGQGDVRYPWGDKEPDDMRFLPCNIWQGEFPKYDTGADGFSGPAAVTAFAPNGYGLYQMVGNVWEWTAEPFRVRSTSKVGRQINSVSKERKLLKGGSYLCHRSYCHRYRIAARTGNTPDSTSGHTGFRVVYDRKPG